MAPRMSTLTERTHLPLLTSLANLHLSCKYVGASPHEIWTIWYINTASLTLSGHENFLCLRIPVITVRRSLHGICYSNSVCPSVRLSVCHTRGLCPHGSTYDHDFFTTG